MTITVEEILEAANYELPNHVTGCEVYQGFVIVLGSGGSYGVLDLASVGKDLLWSFKDRAAARRFIELEIERKTLAN